MSDDTKPGWNAEEIKRLAEFEQGSRERSAEIRAKRESRTGETVEFYEERDVTDPSRVYAPMERPEMPPEVEAKAGPEIGGGEVQPVQAEADEIDAQAVQSATASTEEMTRTEEIRAAARAEVEAAFVSEGIQQATARVEVDEARTAARLQIEAAFGHGGHEIER